MNEVVTQRIEKCLLDLYFIRDQILFEYIDKHEKREWKMQKVDEAINAVKKLSDI